MAGYVVSSAASPTVGYRPPEKRLCEDPFGRGTAPHAHDGPLYLSAFVGGLVTSVVGVLLWVIVVSATHIEIACMAIPLGVLVGIGMRLTGDGAKAQYGLLAGFVCALGCTLGAYVTAGYTFSYSIFDAPCYVLALFAAYRLARGRVARRAGKAQ